MKPNRFGVVLFFLMSLMASLALTPSTRAQFVIATNNGALTITAYTGPGGAVTIPSTTNGYPVVNIDGAFNGNSQVTSVIIPEGVTNIGGATFGGCVSLTNVSLPGTLVNIGDIAFLQTPMSSVTIPARVAHIGTAAFGYSYFLPALNVDPANPFYTSVNGVVFNKSLTTLVGYPSGRAGPYVIPNSVTNIANGAFYQSLIGSVTIPAGVQSIGSEAFFGCPNLAAAYSAATNAPPDTGDEFMFDTAATVYHLDGSPGWGTTFGGAPTAPWSSLFTCTTNGDNTISITGYLSADPVLSIPPSMTGLPVSGLAPGAFATNTSLANAIIPAGVNYISATAFANCVNLSSVTVPGSFTNEFSNPFQSAFYSYPITNVTIADGSASIGSSLFFNLHGVPSSFATVNIPNSVTSIGDRAFRLWYISSIAIPNSVTNIGNTAFGTCFLLTNVILSTNLASLGLSAFVNCSSLASITIPGSLSTIPRNAFVNCSGLTNVMLLNGLTDVGPNAFSGCGSLPSVTIPGTVTNIEDSAFSTCLALTNVNLPNGLAAIGSSAFFHCVSLPSLTLPGSVASLGTNAFAECFNLAGVSIPGSLGNIPDSAFLNCVNLAGISIPTGPTSIGESAFGNCTNLANASLPPGISEVKSTAFLNCTRLGSIVLQNGIASIDANAFANCTSLTSVSIAASGNYISATAFANCVNLSSVTVPGSFTNEFSNPFQSAFYSYPITNVTIADGSASIGSSLFFNLHGVPSSFATVNIPNSVTSIGDRAFRLWYISSIAIPNSVTNIGNTAFGTCFLLTNVILSTNLASLGLSAFVNCSSLASITIPGSLSTIPRNAFVNCFGLTNVTLLNGVRDIGPGAFNNCSSLPGVTFPASVTNIEDTAFSGCGSLAQVYFAGNAPGPGTNTTVFSGTAPGAVAYYLPGTTGWGPIFDGLPTLTWNPQANAAVHSGGQFGFNITGPSNATVVVIATTDLNNPIWTPVSTNVLSVNGRSSFIDSQSALYPRRFYGFRLP